VKVNRGRHFDRDAVVLNAEQLSSYWECAAKRPARQFLAIMLCSLHGLRVSEVASLRWMHLRYRRRGKKPAPAVLNLIGKGDKHRVVQIHPAIRSYLEKERKLNSAEAYILADNDGKPPTPSIVSWWAQSCFRESGITGYAHALRATWTTMALEHRGNAPLQVQQSGGWSHATTMLSHYFKRRHVPSIRLLPAHGTY